MQVRNDFLVPLGFGSLRAGTVRGIDLTKLYNTRFTPQGAWLDGLHRRLDEAVAAAYGWPADIAEDDALARLLALNLARSATPA